MASPEAVVISFELTEGEEAMQIRWDPGTPEDGPREEKASPWQLETEPDWKQLDCVRLVWARFEDGAVLGLAALRPRGAREHGDDVVIARLIDAEGSETAASEALLSAEYDAQGVPRRLGLELWPDAEAAPVRIAADRESETEPGGEAVPMTFRLDGIVGSGRYEILRQG
jgi:hypothetical protein